MFTESKVIEIFCLADDFCIFFDSLSRLFHLKELEELSLRSAPLGVKGVKADTLVYVFTEVSAFHAQSV